MNAVPEKKDEEADFYKWFEEFKQTQIYKNFARAGIVDEIEWAKQLKKKMGK